MNIFNIFKREEPKFQNLLICRTKGAAKQYIEAFGLNRSDWYTCGWGQALCGRGFDKIVFIEDAAYLDNYRKETTERNYHIFLHQRNLWIERVVKNRLTGVNRGDKIFYI